MIKPLKSLTKAQFNKLPNNEKRVLLAQDVIAQIKAKKYVQNHGDYIQFHKKKAKNVTNKVFREELNEQFEHISLMFDRQVVSEKFSNLSAKYCIDSMDQCHVCAKGAVICSFVQNFNKRKIKDINAEDSEIKEIFGDELWSAIEIQFEDEDKSLLSLMQNIVKNNGYLKIGGELIG